MNKILIIEDDPIVGQIYRTRLEKEGYCVETCADGRSGFYRIQEFLPNAVLMDLMLPKMNGIEVLKKIRSQSQFRPMPIVVFTNAYVPNMIQEAFGAGASQVFNKATLTPRQILDALHQLLNCGAEYVETLPVPPSPVPSISHTPAANPAAGHAFSASGGSSIFPSSQPPAQVSSRPGHYPHSPTDFFKPPPSPAAPAEKPAPRVARSLPSGDTAFQSEVQQAFIAAKTETLTMLRKVLQDFTKAADDASREPHLVELYRRTHALTGSAGIAGFSGISQMTAAVEVLLKELLEKPRNCNASTLRTVAHAIDFIGELFRTDAPVASQSLSANILVVDDEILSRRAITYALDKANLKSSNVEDPAVALRLATENAYELIILDVQMPGMDGFELCARIRELPHNKSTPIIFVTGLTDFKSRARSSLSGGTDLIAKPFMFIELTVKALMHVLRNRLIPNKQAA